MNSPAQAVLERGGGVSLWRQVANSLRQEIAERRLAPGAQLPTEGQLAQRFGVNRHTLRRAVAALAEEGLLTVEQGRGTFVHADLIDYVIGRRTRFSENVATQGMQPTGALLDERELPAPAEVARQLGLRRGQKVLLVKSLRSADGSPLSYAENWFPLPRFAGLAEVFRETGSISQGLAACGVDDYLREETRVTAIPGEAEASEVLRQPLSRPLLVVESVNRDLEGQAIQYTRALFAGDRVQLVFRGE